MHHSIITEQGKTTIPGGIRRALKIKPGDRLEYSIVKDGVFIRAKPGLSSLKGCISSEKGKGMTFAEIREAAAKNAVNRHEIKP